jgi:hypothetical protein
VKDLHICDQDGGTNHVDDAELEFLLNRLPSLSKFDVTWTVSPSSFKHLCIEKFPNLVEIDLSVHSEGFEAFLDMMDSYMDSVSSQERRSGLYIHVTCYKGPGFSDVQGRYLGRRQAYSRVEGLQIDVLNI